MSANQQDGEEIFFLFLCSFTFHAKNLLWLDCHSRFFYKLRRESHFRAFPPISILGEERPQNERVRPNTFRDWPPCPPIQRGGGERSRPGVSPFISALTVSCRPATFPGVWPHIWSRCPELWDFLSHRPGAEDEGRGLS